MKRVHITVSVLAVIIALQAAFLSHLWLKHSWLTGRVAAEGSSGGITGVIRAYPKSDGNDYACEIHRGDRLLVAQCFSFDSYIADHTRVSVDGGSVTFEIGGTRITCSDFGGMRPAIWRYGGG
jgi:hypothetical protein